MRERRDPPGARHEPSHLPWRLALSADKCGPSVSDPPLERFPYAANVTGVHQSPREQGSRNGLARSPGRVDERLDVNRHAGASQKNGDATRAVDPVHLLVLEELRHRGRGRVEKIRQNVNIAAVEHGGDLDARETGNAQGGGRVDSRCDASHGVMVGQAERAHAQAVCASN